jgi:hypothetical protein
VRKGVGIARRKALEDRSEKETEDVKRHMKLLEYIK